MDNRHATLVGEVLSGRYRLVRELGSGGMGAVYEGVQADLGRRVAVKVLHPALAEDAEALTRFRREAEAAAALSHPHVVSVTDFGLTDDGLAYLVMELVEGRSLSDLIRDRGSLPVDRSVRVVGQVLSALDAAHRHGIVHRDLKPENIMLQELVGSGDYIRIVDFGVAKLTESTGYTRLTQTGLALGTPAFMAPEQILGRDVDARADIHAVGAVLFCMLTGQRPFRARSDAELWAKIVKEPPPQVPNVPPALADVVSRAMAKDINARFAHAREMLTALGPWLGAGTAPPASTMVLEPSNAPPPLLGTTPPPRMPELQPAHLQFPTPQFPAPGDDRTSAATPMSKSQSSPGSADDRTAAATPAARSHRPQALEPQRLQPQPIQPHSMHPQPSAALPSRPLGAPPAKPVTAALDSEPSSGRTGLILRLLAVCIVAAGTAAGAVVLVLHLTKEDQALQAPVAADAGIAELLAAIPDTGGVTPIAPVPVMSPVLPDPSSNQLPRTGTMHTYREDALARAAETDPGARLTTVMCRGLSNTGENGPWHDAGWSFLFRNPETEMEMAISYWIGSADFPAVGTRPSSAPTPPMDNPALLPESTDVLAAFRAAEGCAPLPESGGASMTYHHAEDVGDRACVNSMLTTLFCAPILEDGTLGESPRCF